MKNKTLAIFGIGAYILSVPSSATNLWGSSIVPDTLIFISGIATAAFVVMATIRLWRKAKNLSWIKKQYPKYKFLKCGEGLFKHKIYIVVAKKQPYLFR